MGSSIGGVVFAKRYDSSGLPIGTSFQVNTPSTQYNVYSPRVASSSNGSFVISWTRVGFGAKALSGISAQLYDSNGTPVGDDIKVNARESYYMRQQDSSAGMASDGSFVVVWQHSNYYGYADNVHARRYSSTGAPLSGDFHVYNLYGITPYPNPEIAVAEDGSFIVTWQNRHQGYYHDIYARQYNSNGGATTNKYRVNTYSSNDQNNATIGMAADSSHVIAWTSSGQDGSGYGIFAQRYEVPDTDLDGINDYNDNCRFIPNADQADIDEDGIGDVCDDSDGDGFMDDTDNCRLTPNDQADLNSNDIGDACDGDIDGDGIQDLPDNCPLISNNDQLDSDDDGTGDACDICADDPENVCLDGTETVSGSISEPVTVSNGAETASVLIEPWDISTDTDVTITGETGSSNFAYGANQQVLGAIYTITVTPSTFDDNVTLTLVYDQGFMPEGGMMESLLDIYKYDTNTLTWVAKDANQDMVQNILSLDVNSFSSYAVIARVSSISKLLSEIKEVNTENSGILTNLVSKVEEANKLYEKGNNKVAANLLNAFINDLRAISGKKIDSSLADILIYFAEQAESQL